MKTIVIVVENCGNPADPVTVPAGKKEICGGMLEKGMFRFIQEPLHLQNQRGHPKGIALIDFPGKSDKLLHVPGTFDSDYFYWGQSVPFPSRQNRLGYRKIFFYYCGIIFKAPGNEDIDIL